MFLWCFYRRLAVLPMVDVGKWVSLWEDLAAGERHAQYY